MIKKDTLPLDLRLATHPLMVTVSPTCRENADIKHTLMEGSEIYNLENIS
jgi:hypothetical protein